MHMRLLTALTVTVGCAFSLQAQASSDDSCYPRWSLIKDNLEPCSNLAFLSPGNDSQINLRLLLADKGVLPPSPQPLQALDLEQGYGQVPFPVYRLRPEATPADAQPTSKAVDPLAAPLQRLGLSRPATTAGQEFLQGEGSRCRSNDQASATAFISAVLNSPELTDNERKALAHSRLQMLGACSWDPDQQTSLLPGNLASSEAQAFALYLGAAADFYSGRFDAAASGFARLADSRQPWLNQTAAYMSARTLLNQVQETGFTEYGEIDPDRLDLALLGRADQAFQQYLAQWPQGDYAASARGLLRRVHWLAGNDDKLADEYVWQLTQASDAQRNASLDGLINEIDIKLLINRAHTLQEPLLLAVIDLMSMREQARPGLSLEDLQAQQPVFANDPAMYDYLLAAHAFYVQDNPAKALEHLPQPPAAGDTLSYLSFSQQMLRGLALQARQDFKGAQQTWLAILPMAKAPLQREQLELALSMSYEHDEQLSGVFAADSPIQSRQVRNILLSHVADAQLLREQTLNGLDTSERNLALFVLLYKDLLRGRYADFAQDLKRLPEPLPKEQLGYGLGYVYQQGPSLELFQWQGDKAESGYSCPSIAQTAAALQADSKDPQALNCLGEFILRNRLDSMPLDQRRDADTLGGSAPGFAGEVFSRLDGYRQVIDNPKAGRDDKAYALFRAINCYAPSGYNSCGGQEVEPATRKAWFRQLKGSYASTQWGKTLQYYW
ncbi:outer membrane assembly lipoprotein YfiO [Pseudomonas sp. LJDD11]|uniref:outer membrane assembly lipoprotein YfiO n=1 Tax=Pseudomonas sp. LJDD11 TaxID=2931984 RepID=UPI00211C0F1D|nr:outer membrane assembly lipoprotein YfiO [Pseudomonas sp. LJDD11]MCQ9426561.1 outer membrane assembly lipoprotein YfiO [Pseudomonas sp. LJDD11]